MGEAVASGWTAAKRQLAAELRAFPGRWNVALRCLLACAIVIVVSQALQVPFLAVSLFVVFFATQANLVLTRLVGLLMFVGITLAVAAAVLLAKFTFGYPAWRIVAVAALLFGCLFLMRASRIGPVFYVVAVVITAVQGYFDLIPDAEWVVRAILWAWIAAVYPLMVCVLINALLLPVEPLQQLKAEVQRQLAQVEAALARAAGERSETPDPDRADFSRGVLAVQKLLRFAWMRDAAFRGDRARHLALAAGLSSLREQALHVQPARDAAEAASMAALRAAVRRLDACIQAETPFDLHGIAVESGRDTVRPPLAPMWRTLRALAERDAPSAPVADEAKSGLLAADAYANPVYVQFALKTVLAMMLCYLFYAGADWTGLHTVMMTCLIVAQPSLGASSRKIRLRVIGALIGGTLALLLTVFVLPRLDTIVGLLLISLPVLAASAYLAAGSERISYAGMQIMFTFSLAILGDFSASDDLAGIRDRLIGIGLGITVSYLVHVMLWPEPEGQPLVQQIGALLKRIAALIGDRSGAGPLAGPAASTQAWAALGACEETLARVAFEPGWQQAEGEREGMILRLQDLIAQAREILIEAGTVRRSLDARADELDASRRDTLASAQAGVAARLQRYADELSAGGDLFLALPLDEAPRMPPAIMADDAYGTAQRHLYRLAARVQDLTTASARTDASHPHSEAAYP
ncbi:MAG TPA: FUSC family protein [Dokdonella sp.]|uniref:FUSC family protein n=1 Tax=Dokdonella sp. TaxID=2291710 RepID=UPI002CAD3078|nr:FUSC family protein [Dokdonella sp.]HUD43463.1 FUSC family protein [Dokdonella sp.]